MRPKERIPIFLDKINFDYLQKRWDIDLSNEVRGLIMSEPVRKYWESAPDLRFGQMLINLDYIPDMIAIWMDEDLQILLDQGCEPREVVLWGNNYDVNHNLLPEIRWILIKDMNTDHIKQILKEVENNRYNLKQSYLDLFRKELQIRNS